MPQRPFTRQLTMLLACMTCPILSLAGSATAGWTVIVLPSSSQPDQSMS